MTSKNWYWIVLLVAVLLVFNANCVSRPEGASHGRMSIVSDILRYNTCF